MLRRLLPSAIAALVLLGVLRWLGERQGLYGTTAGIVLLTAAAVVVGKPRKRGAFRT